MFFQPQILHSRRKFFEKKNIFRLLSDSPKFREEAIAPCPSYHATPRRVKLLSAAVYKPTVTHVRYGTFLRPTAVPAGTAERVLAMGILSVCLARRGTDSSPDETETSGFQHMIA